MLEKLIKEELGKFFNSHSLKETGVLNEIEYKDTDIINSDSIDLYREYNKLNSQLYNDELPKVPMQWSNRKGNLGHVRAMINQHTRESNIKHLAISSFHAMTYMIFKNTLAHEMIHIKQLSTHTFDPSSPHGYSFINEANRINRMGLGYNITKSSEEMLDISDKTRAKGKELIAILFNINGRYTVTVTTPRVFETDIDYVIRIFDRSINAGKYRKIEILAVESSNPELLKYTIQRTYKNRISHAPISDELRDDLLGSKVVKLVILERDKPRYMSETDNADDAGNWEEIIIV